MSGGPEAHESTGIIFVETQVRGGIVWLGLGAGVGTCRGLVMHVCGGRGRPDGAPKSLRAFLQSHRPHWGCPKPTGGGQGPVQPLYMSQWGLVRCRGL